MGNFVSQRALYRSKHVQIIQLRLRLETCIQIGSPKKTVFYVIERYLRYAQSRLLFAYSTRTLTVLYSAASLALRLRSAGFFTIML